MIQQVVLRQLVAPAVLALVGVGTFAAAEATRPEPAVRTPAVWVETPGDGAVLAPGEVAVAVHATALATVTGIELLVDDAPVGRTSDLARDDRLVFATVTWAATAGSHVLVARQLGGAGTESAPVAVQVREQQPAGTTTTRPAEPDEPAATTTTSSPAPTTSDAEAGATTTTTGEPSTTTTTVAPEVPEPTAPPSTRPPATVPPTRPTPTTAPVPPPVIDSAMFLGTEVLYQCSITSVEVGATVRGATSVRLLASNGWSTAMTRQGGAWRVTIVGGRLPVGDWWLQVRATSAGGSATRDVGTIDVRPGCPKD